MSRASRSRSWSAPLTVDDPNAIAVAVEGDAEVEALFNHSVPKVGQIVRHGRVGMVIRECSVDLREQHLLPARQSRGELFDYRTGRPVAAVPCRAGNQQALHDPK
jgi:hypothetical protein